MNALTVSFVLGLVAALPLSAEPPAPASSVPVVTIVSVREFTFDNWIAADGVFRIKWPCLKVSLRTSRDVKGSEIVGRAYFFDNDKKELSHCSTIPNANHADGSYGLPPLLKAHANIDVFVPIDTASKEGKWRMAILVFGDSHKLSTETYPQRGATDWKGYDFREKDALLAQIKEAEEAKKNRSSLPPRPAGVRP